MRKSDLPFAQEVREIAGWNQTEADWLRLMDSEPEGCFLIESDGQPAGTATTTCYGTDLAWVGMVLVHPGFRRRGLATALLEHCIRSLRDLRAVRCIRLDATPEGQMVYEKLGFQVDYELARWEGSTTEGPEQLGEDWCFQLVGDLDRMAFGADRGKYLERLAADSRCGVRGGGYGMIRHGARAEYLGPVVAGTTGDGSELVGRLLLSARIRPVYWDIPESNRAATHLAEELGFIRKRELIRMSLGEPVSDRPDLQWAIGAPETG